jgi:hypothetical protein
MRTIPLLALALAACGTSEAARAPQSAQSQSRTATVGAVAPTDSHNAAPADTGNRAALDDTSIVRGLYVNRFAAQSAKRMRNLIAIADSTEVNALVIDIKDEFGLNYSSQDALVAKNAGSAGHIAHLKELVDTLKAHDITPIARIVVFKDSVAARVNPEHTIRKPDGTAWRDKKGLTWVNPYDRSIWEYNIRVAEEMARVGFREIQFDYIRFPEPYKSLPPQVFPGSNGLPKPQALAEFFREACPRIRKLGARCTADIFGLVTTVNGPLEVGQEWEQLSPVSDVLLPMVYPSHYPHGSFAIARPNAEPFRVVNIAISKAHERDLKLGIVKPEHVRPWLQAFTLGQPRYGAAEVQEQKRAVYEAGYDGWVLWHPGSIYEPFLAGLEKRTTSHKKMFALK